MKVKELIALLKKVNPNADVLVDINGGKEYHLDTEETAEQNDPDELKTCKSYSLVVFE
jgi:hypothetical protein